MDNVVDGDITTGGAFADGVRASAQSPVSGQGNTNITRTGDTIVIVASAAGVSTFVHFADADMFIRIENTGDSLADGPYGLGIVSSHRFGRGGRSFVKRGNFTDAANIKAEHYEFGNVIIDAIGALRVTEGARFQNGNTANVVSAIHVNRSGSFAGDVFGSTQVTSVGDSVIATNLESGVKVNSLIPSRDIVEVKPTGASTPGAVSPPRSSPAPWLAASPPPLET